MHNWGEEQYGVVRKAVVMIRGDKWRSRSGVSTIIRETVQTSLPRRKGKEEGRVKYTTSTTEFMSGYWM